MVIPLSIMLLILKSFGVFNKFWFWTIQYAIEYENQISLNDAIPLFKRMFNFVIKDFYLVWIFSGLGLITLFFNPKIKKNQSILFLLLFTFFSFLAICPGFYFRPHYFVVFLPAVAILFGVFIDYIINLNFKLKIISLLKYYFFVIPILLGIISQKDYLFKLNTEAILLKTYGYFNPFIQSIKIAEYVKSNSQKNDKIAIIGSEPQIFFYANRHSATGYIFTFSLKENQKHKLKMQKEMASEIELSKPKLIVFFPDSIPYVSDWLTPYLHKQQYQVTGIVDIFSGLTIYKWDEEALNYKPRSELYAIIYKKTYN